jgi:triphosphoribosyl-dephospho-CoA synthase
MRLPVFERPFERSIEVDGHAERLAVQAVDALAAEAELTPKPGLVDRRGSGAHTDMSCDLMLRSAKALRPFFRSMAFVARGQQPSQRLREELAVIGRGAERAMLAATGGVNTHKGAIWLVGLLTAAAGVLPNRKTSASLIAETAGEIACFEDRASLSLVSHGCLVQRRYGATGARGEAQRGFPHVLSAGLPVLRARRAAGALEDDARLDALLHIMTTLEDTCLLYRGGDQGLRTAQSGAAAVLEAGGCATDSGRMKLLALDRKLLEMCLSPGGSADLLAATLFVDAIEQELAEIHPRVARTPRFSRIRSRNDHAARRDC